MVPLYRNSWSNELEQRFIKELGGEGHKVDMKMGPSLSEDLNY